MRRSIRTLPVGVAVAAAIVSTAPPARAQGMVPPRGAGSITIGYQTSLIKKHYLVDREVDGGQVESQALVADFGIGLGRNFALGVALPLVAARYTGTLGHEPTPEELLLHPDFSHPDDGTYHGGFQDFRFELRYAWSRNGWHAMPFVTVVLPSHQYEFLGHASTGRRIREVRVGAALHRLLNPLSARSYVQAHAAYAFQQEIIGVPRTATHLNLEGGYFARPDLTVFGGMLFHVTHGGIDWNGNPRVQYSGPLFINHDRLSRERLLNLGVGANYSLSRRNAITGSISRTVDGINGHKQEYLLMLSFTRSFGGPHIH